MRDSRSAIARSLLLGGIIFAVMAVAQQLGHISTPARESEHVSPPKIVPAPSAPSVFAKEQAMSPAGLMRRWDGLIAQASRKFKVPAKWIYAVMRQESGGRTMMAENVPIVSAAGAMGIMQVMPGTYREMAAQYGLGDNPFDPHDNIYAGAAYLRWLKAKYGYPAMFAAYNAGPGNVEDHLHRGRPLPAETRGYIASIGKMLGDKAATGNFAKVALTQPDGDKVAVDASMVSAVRPATPGIYAEGVRSVITVGDLNRGVRESVAQATALLRAHGAPI
jgi:membrane-bound lytic murein transglycosylase B